MEILGELTLVCTGVENVYLCIYLVFLILYQNLHVCTRIGRETSRTLVCILLVLEVIEVENHVGSGPRSCLGAQKYKSFLGYIN